MDDVSFGSDEILSTPSLPILNNNDDILNALINSKSFVDEDECIILNFGLAPESSEIGNLFATSLGELPRQSTIEETMENMTLNHPQTGKYSLKVLNVHIISWIRWALIGNLCANGQFTGGTKGNRKYVNIPFLS